MQKLAFFTIVLTLGASGLATTRVPRKSPELAIHEPSGTITMLSSFKGKVVVIEFLFLKSAHCMRVAQTLDRLQQDLGPRGLQAVAIAFPAPGSEATGPLVRSMVNYFKLTYPVGYTNSDSVDKYLSRGKYEVLNIPQVVLIDRRGMIRAQSGGRPGDPKLENEGSLRTLLEGLLQEIPPGVPARQVRPATTSKS